MIEGCMSNPCLNGATCTDMTRQGDFTCTCRQGFTGGLCQMSDVCAASRPCGTQGTCLPLERGHPISFVCVCAGGQTVGATCESAETNPCVSAPPIVPNSKEPPTMFALKMNANVFVQCEGLKPNVRFCQFPLKFSFAKQMCDWN